MTGGAARSRMWVSRLVWGGAAVLAISVLATAAWLTPSAEGHGTHTQLGLPPCGFLLFTGLPCPGCGLTTAFAHMVRLEIVGAAMANPFGIPLVLVTALSIPISIVGLVRGRSVIDVLDRLRFERWALALAVAGILVWAVRVGAIILAR